MFLSVPLYRKVCKPSHGEGLYAVQSLKLSVPSCPERILTVVVSGVVLYHLYI